MRVLTVAASLAAVAAAAAKLMSGAGAMVVELVFVQDPGASGDAFDLASSYVVDSW